MSEISVIVIFANHSIFLDNITHSSFNKSVAWIKLVVPISLRIIVWLSIRYNECNRNAHTNFRYFALLKVILPGNSQGKPGNTQSRVRSYGVAKEVALAITVSFFLT